MILLDTHAWIWLVDNPDRIPTRTLDEIETQDLILVSTISCWEIAMLSSKGRLDLNLPTKEWIDRTLAAPGFELIPLSAEAARLAGSDELDWSHTDPADRMIVATALDLDIPLVTADHKIHKIEGFTTIW